MRSETVQAVHQVVDSLLPKLDATGFSVTRLGLSPDTGRFLIGYNEPVERIPEIFVDAIAAVTQVDVDFVHGGAIAIALFTREYLDLLGPRRAKVTIEELVAAREH